MRGVVKEGVRRTASNYIYFSQEIAEHILQKECAINYVLRRDKYTDEISLILGAIDGAPSARWEVNKLKGTKRLVINQREIVNYLCKRYGHPADEDCSLKIMLSEDVSRNDDAAMFKLLKLAR